MLNPSKLPILGNYNVGVKEDFVGLIKKSPIPHYSRVETLKQGFIKIIIIKNY